MADYAKTIVNNAKTKNSKYVVESNDFGARFLGQNGLFGSDSLSGAGIFSEGIAKRHAEALRKNYPSKKVAVRILEGSASSGWKLGRVVSNSSDREVNLEVTIKEMERQIHGLSQGAGTAVHKDHIKKLADNIRKYKKELAKLKKTNNSEKTADSKPVHKDGGFTVYHVPSAKDPRKQYEVHYNGLFVGGYPDASSAKVNIERMKKRPIENMETGNTDEKKFAHVMRMFEKGTLKSSDGSPVKSKEQAEAIAFSESGNCDKYQMAVNSLSDIIKLAKTNPKIRNLWNYQGELNDAVREGDFDGVDLRTAIHLIKQADDLIKKARNGANVDASANIVVREMKKLLD
jgi:hypothetical protein